MKTRPNVKNLREQMSPRYRAAKNQYTDFANSAWKWCRKTQRRRGLQKLQFSDIQQQISDRGDHGFS